MRLPTGLYAGSVNLQELYRAPRAGSWTSRVSSIFHLPSVISSTTIVYQLKMIYAVFANLLLAFNHICLLHFSMLRVSLLLVHYGKCDIKSYYLILFIKG